MIRPLSEPVAEQYQLPCARTPGRYEGLVNFAHKLSGLFGSSLRGWAVLDVGGADGWLGSLLVMRQYLWVDPQPQSLGLSAPHEYELTAAGVAEALPFRARAVDLVVSKQTLPHFTDPLLACREMRRVARHAVVLRQDWGSKSSQGGYLPIGWPGHSRSQIDAPSDILEAVDPSWAVAAYDGTDFLWRR